MGWSDGRPERVALIAASHKINEARISNRVFRNRSRVLADSQIPGEISP